MNQTLGFVLKVVIVLVLLAAFAGFLALYGSGLYNLFPIPTPLPTLAGQASDTPSPTDTITETAATEVSKTTDTPATETATETATESGFQFPTGVVNVAQGFCRYGPGTAYLYYDDLYEGQSVTIGGRNIYGGWLLVMPDDQEIWCWAAQSLFDISGDINTVVVQDTRLPITTFSGPPTGVSATREGDQVTIRWNAANHIPPEDRRGYLLEVFLCQNGVYFWQATQTDNTQITLQDDQSCTQPAKGTLRIAEKHGYSDPVEIPWP